MQKDFDKWNKRKKELDSKVFTRYIHEREIWWCSIGINVGDEEDGKNSLFERPVLIIKKFNQRIVLIIPLTTKIKDNPYYFLFSYNNVKFAAILSQIRLLSTFRLSRRIRAMDESIFEQIQQDLIKKIIL